MYNTVSLEVAKELKELGWKKKCYWFYGDNEGEFVIYNSSMYCRDGNSNDLESPQLHEIIELLPKLPYQGTAADPLASQDVIFAKTEAGYAIRFSQSDIFVNRTNPHDAAALLWIWCVKEGHISLIN